jgi:hypothetical protein
VMYDSSSDSNDDWDDHDPFALPDLTIVSHSMKGATRAFNTD